MDPRELSDLTETSVAIIKLECIAHVSRQITHFQCHHELVEILSHAKQLLTLIVLGLHIYHHYIGIAVVIDIRNIVAHGEVAVVVQRLSSTLCESTILMVDVYEIIIDIIVRNVYVWPPIAVEITHGYTQSITFDEDTRFFRDICESVISVVAI